MGSKFGYEGRAHDGNGRIVRLHRGRRLLKSLVNPTHSQVNDWHDRAELHDVAESGQGHPNLNSPDLNSPNLSNQDVRHQLQRERLVTAIAHRIRASLDLDTILNRTVEEIRLFLGTDRVLIYRFEEAGYGTVAVETVTPPWAPLIGTNFQDPCFPREYVQNNPQGHIQVIPDIHTAGLDPCYFEFLTSLQVRANLVIPIVSEQRLWGLLIAHHCRGPLVFSRPTVDLLKQLATQVGIAVLQAELHRQVNACNLHLESQVQERTAKLQQALEFEALVRRITEKMRDSLDESQVLQAVAQELFQGLHVQHCKVELYDATQTYGTIAYEYTTTDPSCQGLVRILADSDIHRQLLQKHPLQFTAPPEAPGGAGSTRLVCPIFDAEGTLGNLWLVRPGHQVFDDAEVACVQLVASQCAIAVRQARLYEAAQQHVQELGKLIRFKDDFLMGISHALQTPLSGMHLAIQTLEHLLKTPDTADPIILARTVGILRAEYQRESRLVNNLLTLAYADGGEQLAPVCLDLCLWLPRLVESWRHRMEQRGQVLTVAIASDLPALVCDAVYLERILYEFLTNAYKYTPAGGKIGVRAELQGRCMAIQICNSGVEIPVLEQDRIFEKFYRIASSDIWESGGAGLGLTVVQKLAARLDASVRVASTPSQTQFTLHFPAIVVE
jgi:GAF domain-containing protein/anti-sigma regulatory factor (Ser/Thr protein kinase)